MTTEMGPLVAGAVAVSGVGGVCWMTTGAAPARSAGAYAFELNNPAVVIFPVGAVGAAALFPTPPNG